MEGAALVAGVSPPEPYVYAETGRVRVAVLDYGAKRSIMRRLHQAGAAVTVFPHTSRSPPSSPASTASCSRTGRVTPSR